MTVNYAPHQSQCYVWLPRLSGNGQWRLQDVLGNATYARERNNLQARELCLDVPPRFDPGTGYVGPTGAGCAYDTYGQRRAAHPAWQPQRLLPMALHGPGAEAVPALAYLLHKLSHWVIPLACF